MFLSLKKCMMEDLGVKSRRLSANSQKVQKEYDYILYMKYIKHVIYNIKGMIKQNVKLVNLNKECMEVFCTIFCIC